MGFGNLHKHAKFLSKPLPGWKLPWWSEVFTRSQVGSEDQFYCR